MLKDLIEKASKLQEVIDQQEELLKKEKEELNKILYEELPEKLELEGIDVDSKFITQNGYKVSYKNYFSAEIPSNGKIEKAQGEEKEILWEKRKNCLNWLKENGLGDIIKDQFKIDTNRDKELTNKIDNFVKENNILAIHEEDVHAMTLKSALKEQMNKGVDLPQDLFNIKIGTRVELKK